MEERVKKTAARKTAAKAPAKRSEKAAAAKKVEGMSAAPKAKKTVAAAKPTATAKKKAAPVAKPAVTREAIAMLAHRYWTERGGSHGYHEEDWFRAEQELRGKAS
jgi:Protein of unknown function (DUF2934)